jgi:hypothetical protein
VGCFIVFQRQSCVLLLFRAVVVFALLRPRKLPTINSHLPSYLTLLRHPLLAHMSTLVRIACRVRSTTPVARYFSSSAAPGVISKHNRPGASVPLVQHYRSSWPNTAHDLPEGVEEPVLPPRTIDDSVLHFKLSARYYFGSSVFYPNLDYHPADFKVALMVKTADLGLNDEQVKILLRMVGPCYNQGRKEVKLTCRRFSQSYRK